MKLDSFLKIFLCLMIVTSLGFSRARQQVNVNFKNLKIEDFIKLTAKILKKNILLTIPIRGTVGFLSSKPIYKDELLNIAQSILASKGFTLVDNNTFLEVVRLSEASKHNLPVVKNSVNSKQMITQAIKIKNENAATVAGKIRHLLSKSAKLIVDRESNDLLITDFPENIKTIQKVIKILEDNSEKKVSFVKLKNVKVQKVFADISKIIHSVFNPKIPDEKVTIIPNRDSNMLVVVGLKKSVKKLIAIIKKFDVKDEKTMQQVKIIALKNTKAANTFKAIQFIIKSKKYPTPDTTPVISVDTDTNSLIVLGPKDAIEDIQKIIQELDREKPQVYVKAQIIEVNENLASKLGAKYGFQAGAISGSGLLNMSANLGGSPIAASALSQLVKLDSGIKQGLILGATIDFLKTNSAINVVSEPSLLCVNNKESSIYVGQTKSIQTGTETTSGGNTIDKYTREDIGLTLKIKPLISNDKKVTLDITTILEDVSEITTNGQPDTSKKEIKTVALVRDGENVIIGGLIKNKVDHQESKVPLLGDIPILGAAFRHSDKVVNKINLVVILTPYIVEASSDLTALRSKLAKLDGLESKVSKKLKKFLESKENNASK